MLFIKITNVKIRSPNLGIRLRGYILSAYPIPCILSKEDIMKTIKEFQKQVDKVNKDITTTSYMGMRRKAGFYDKVSHTNFMAYPSAILRGSLPYRVKAARANHIWYLAPVCSLLDTIGLPYKTSPNLSVITIADGALTILDESVGSKVIQSIKDTGKPVILVDKDTKNIPYLVAKALFDWDELEANLAK